MTTQLPDWLRQLRRNEIVRKVQQDPRSTGSSILGYTRDDAMRAIGGGQALFDEPDGNLSPDDRVLLYCYLNQLGHLEELVEALGQIFANAPPTNEPIVVDLGCGPFTGGLALASILGPKAGFDYVGMDRSNTMREFGETLANAAAHSFPNDMPAVRRYWIDELSACPWPSAPGWRSVTVIVSYLFASRTLDVAKLVDDLGTFLDILGRGEVTVLYTNSVKYDPDRNYPEFRDSLRERGFEELVSGDGRVIIERTGKERQLRYALLYRSLQTELKL